MYQCFTNKTLGFFYFIFTVKKANNISMTPQHITFYKKQSYLALAKGHNELKDKSLTLSLSTLNKNPFPTWHLSFLEAD